MESKNFVIDIVIPCFKVGGRLTDVLKLIPNYVRNIYVIDDACPFNDLFSQCEKSMLDNIIYIRNEINLGVGGATLAGMVDAFKNNADCVIKVDGDGQMDLNLLENFIFPIKSNIADYVKGNRFYSLNSIKLMPVNRILLNSVVTILSKFSSGYWNVLDPTNGYIAIKRDVFYSLSINKIDKRYFFESDLLFHLNLAGAVVQDVNTKSIYGNEKSNIKFFKNLYLFLMKYTKNFFTRVIITYFIKDFNIGGLYFILSILLNFIGITLGFIFWYKSYTYDVPSSSGSVMIVGLLLIFGLQFAISFLSIDYSNSLKFLPRENNK